jgi:hypothetical protein
MLRRANTENNAGSYCHILPEFEGKSEVPNPYSGCKESKYTYHVLRSITTHVEDVRRTVMTIVKYWYRSLDS